MQNNQPVYSQEVVAVLFPHVVIYTRRRIGDEVIETLRIEADNVTERRRRAY